MHMNFICRIKNLKVIFADSDLSEEVQRLTAAHGNTRGAQIQ